MVLHEPMLFHNCVSLKRTTYLYQNSIQKREEKKNCCKVYMLCNVNLNSLGRKMYASSFDKYTHCIVLEALIKSSFVLRRKFDDEFAFMSTNRMKYWKK